MSDVWLLRIGILVAGAIPVLGAIIYFGQPRKGGRATPRRRRQRPGRAEDFRPVRERRRRRRRRGRGTGRT